MKVERPDRGDEARAWGPLFWEDGSVMFYAANLSKRSLALDVKRGADVLLRLVDGADVFIQSLRPGAAERLGLGADALRAAGTRSSSPATSARSRPSAGRWAAKRGTTRCCRRSPA